ncbi:MAG: hypothetical protein WKG00_12620 [Polyangiaceae bacterium]
MVQAALPEGDEAPADAAAAPEATAPAGSAAPIDAAAPIEGAAPAEAAAPPTGTVPAAGDPATLPVAWLAQVMFVTTLVVSATLALAKVVTHFDISTLWDDAYMFVRYGENLLREGRLAWNPGGEATYGLTTPLVLLVTVPLALITGHNAALTAMLTSITGGVLFVFFAIRLWRGAPGSRAVRLTGLALSSVCVALSATPEHFVSGMDTTFVLAYGAGWLLLVTRLEQRPTPRLAALIGVVGGLAFWARPDLCVYTLAVPAALAVVPRQRERRAAGAIALGATAVTLGAVLLVNKLYFASALPLPFYAKSTGVYGTAIRRSYRGIATIELFAFLTWYWPLLAVVGLDVIANARRWWRTSPVDLALVVGTVVCILYYWLVPLPVMFFSSRFFHPVLPALLLLSWRSLPRLVERLPALRDAAMAPLAACVALVAVGTALVPAALTAARDAITAMEWKRIGWFDVQQHAKEPGPLSYWARLDKLPGLPDDLVIASTEVGMLAAVNPRKVVVDLAGLNERRFAHQRFSAERFFQAYQPDLIYMPHPHYEEMIEALQKSAAFKDYEEIDKKTLEAREFGVALRKSSKHYPALRAIFGKTKKKLPATGFIR